MISAECLVRRYKKMLTINFKQVYETNEKVDKEWVLIIYDFSANHYVGMPVYSKEKEGCIYCNSINKYVDINKIADYNRSKVSRCIYVHGKPIKLSKKDFNLILMEGKKALIEFLNKNVNDDIDGINYIKWCRDKYIINQKDIEEYNLIQNAIYWVDFGIGVGSELRKLRPAILWRPASHKTMWTMIPLTTKRRSDKYDFHYDLECLAEGTAKIENMMNLSSKRILAPYFAKDKLAIITKNDYNEIKKAISKYYLFK